MTSLPGRPRREPALVFERRSDGEVVEVWATKHTRRSHDRLVDGTAYYRALIAVGGAVQDHRIQRFESEAAAVASVRRLFGLDHADSDNVDH